jgi:hypothetical protein
MPRVLVVAGLLIDLFILCFRAFCGSQARSALFNTSRSVRQELLVNLGAAPVTVALRDGTTGNMRAGMGIAALLPRPQKQRRTNRSGQHSSADTLAAAASSYQEDRDQASPPPLSFSALSSPENATSSSAAQQHPAGASALAACLPRTVTIRSHAPRGLGESRFLLCLSGLLHGASHPQRGLTPLIGSHVRHLVLRVSHDITAGCAHRAKG